MLGSLSNMMTLRLTDFDIGVNATTAEKVFLLRISSVNFTKSEESEDVVDCIYCYFIFNIPRQRQFAAPRNVFFALSPHVPQFTGKFIIRKEHNTFNIYLQSVTKIMGKTAIWAISCFYPLPPLNNVEKQQAKFASSYVMVSQHCIEGKGDF